MSNNKFIKLILVFVLFLFSITTTGVYTWAPVIAKNLDHHHDLNISIVSGDISHWTLVHHDNQISQEDTKNHNWKSYDQSALQHSVKPITIQEHFALDPVFFLSFALPLILLFLSFFEIPIRSFGFRTRQSFISNSYTYTKALIVLRN